MNHLDFTRAAHLMNGEVDAGPAPGKRSLTAAIQRKGPGRPAPAGSHRDAGLPPAPAEPTDPFWFATGAIHATAQRGIEGSGTALPHLAQIQAAFGPHDVSGIRAHVGGKAAEASQAIGAQAYATGNDVAFAAPPDLETAAHEAAHVVQQRAGVQLLGGLGTDGDGYERHADAVAQAVVRGESAAALLGEPAGTLGGGTAIQRRVEVRPYGTYWVGDDEPQPEHQQLERIDEEDFGRLGQLWAGLNAGGGSFAVSEQDAHGHQHPGFKARVLGALATLLSRPHGRRLIGDLVASGRPIQVVPSVKRETLYSPTDDGCRTVEDAAGAPTGGVVEVDPMLADTTSYDQDYNKLPSPAFITLGHELIHARHASLGLAAPHEAKPKVADDYDELEEEETIATGNPHDQERGVTENMLRDEHDLRPRFGHQGTLDEHLVPLPGELTIDQVALLGGVDRSGLLADNPALADRLLDRDRGLAAPFVNAMEQPAVRNDLLEVDIEVVQDALRDEEMFAQAAGKVLRGDLQLAATTLARLQAGTFAEMLMAHAWMQDALQAQEIEALFGEANATVLQEHAELVRLLIDAESCFETLRERDDVVEALSVVPGVRLNVALSQLEDAQAVSQRLAATPGEILAANPEVGAQRCPLAKLRLRGCVSHRVRRIEDALEDKPHILADYARRGDDELLSKLNPTVDWQDLALGQEVIVPVTV